jgi:DNA-binding LacI/PurR family transcriptional regulator
MATTKQTPKTGILAIAQAAGVAPSTVSRFFNDGQVSAKTRLKIEKAVAKTGYRPDSRAASLRKGSTNRIGVIVPDIGNPAYSATLRVFHDLLRERDYSLVLGCTYGQVAEEHKLLQYMLQDHVDGIILYTCEGPQDAQSHQYLKQLLDQKTPVVYVGKQNNMIPTDSLTVDNRLGIDKAIRYLHRIGRKHIAFLSGDTTNWAYQQRVESFQRVMKSLKLKLSSKSILTMGQSTIETGGILLPRLLEQMPQVDAVVCSNDLCAIGAMYAAQQMGIKVPQQLAVVGFDDIQMASLVRPQLTTIRQPILQMARQTCLFLLSRLAGEQMEPQSLLFEPELVVRESA